MSKVLSYEDRLRGDFKRYLIKIAANKSNPELTEAEILKAFDLAVQKQKLTTLEHELLESKKSKIDVSRELPYKELFGICKDFVFSIAEVEQGTFLNEETLLTVDRNSFDEPCSTMQARKVLIELARVANVGGKNIS